jgi:alcohol dehydrogenase-like protein
LTYVGTKPEPMSERLTPKCERTNTYRIGNTCLQRTGAQSLGGRSHRDDPGQHRCRRVRVDCTTICGTDLHILKGDVPEVTNGRILGHEAVGTVEAVGSGVTTVAPLRPVSWRGRLDPGPPN